MTLQPPVTHFRVRTCRCSSVSVYQEPPKCSTRPVGTAANHVQTTSFGRKFPYVSPLPSPVEDGEVFKNVKSVRSTLDTPCFPPYASREATESDAEALFPPFENSFSSPTSSFGSFITTPPPSSEEEEEKVETPCKSILRRSNGEMEERLMTAPGGGGYERMGAISPLCIGQSLSAFSKKGVRFDVERNSTHTYEKDSCDDVPVNASSSTKVFWFYRVLKNKGFGFRPAVEFDLPKDVGNIYIGQLMKHESSVKLSPKLRAFANPALSQSREICGFHLITKDEHQFPFEVDLKNASLGTGEIRVRNDVPIDFTQNNVY
ncbi:unnamed protein product, partial [Hydatigera taeniaeformis]|uniref:DUF547 domain-containing protein n=1 Tax=Hydatigena taeniaeformis TaxID=6205 RepID=A0A0R3WR38_HYDTA